MKSFGKHRRSTPAEKTEAPTQHQESSPLLRRALEAARQGQATLPAFLRYPDDPISQLMFEPQMRDVVNAPCRYQFRLYTEIADVTPETRVASPMEEVHTYWKEGQPAWCSVSTMKSPSVKTSPLNGWLGTDQFSEMFGQINQLLRCNAGRDTSAYQSCEKGFLGQSKEYDRLHQFAESCVFAHVFTLGGQYYKKFILLARQEEIAWRVECTIPSDVPGIAPTDFVPPALVFGSFFPYPCA